MPSLIWFSFYPRRWLSDPELRSCSLAARGLWIDLLASMSERNPRGFLSNKDHPLTTEQIARTVGAHQEEVQAYLEELEAAGVLSRDERGVIFSRGMVRDEATRVAARKRQQASRYKKQPLDDEPAADLAHKATPAVPSNAAVTPPVTPLSRQCHANVTPMSQVEYKSIRVAENNSSSSARDPCARIKSAVHPAPLAAAAAADNLRKTFTDADVVEADEADPASNTRAADTVSRQPTREWDEGFPRRQVQSLERLYGAEKVRKAMCAIWSRAEAGEKVRNPLGLLRTMLQNGFTPAISPPAASNPFFTGECV